MRMARWKADENTLIAHYHCISRVVDRRFALGDEEKEHFLRLMRGYEVFCGVKVVSFCCMSNHFHILVEVPRRPPPEGLPDEKQLVGFVVPGKGFSRKALAKYLDAKLPDYMIPAAWIELTDLPFNVVYLSYNCL